MSDYTTLALVKAYAALNQDSAGTITSGRDDSLISTMITGYSRAIEDYCGWVFYSVTKTDKVFIASGSMGSRVQVDNDGILWLRTKSPTISSVTSASYKFTVNGTYNAIDSQYFIYETLDADDRPTERSYQIGIASGQVDWGTYRNAPIWIKATYTGGYSTVPSAIQEACMEWVMYAYKMRESVPLGTVQIPAMGTIIRPLSIPLHIERILTGWRRTWQ